MIMKTPKELKTLKEKMQALQSGDYDVEAENPKIVKCWERLGCEKKDCPAYGKLRCWSIAGTSCHGEVQGKFAQKLGDCRECVVYKESCGDDIGELIEIFNQMAKDIRYNFAEQVRFDEETAKEERVSALQDMVAGVAHETRNPLHSIGMAASFLKKNFQDELITEFLTIIEDEVRKLSDLTSLFLSFSHPVPLKLEPCRMNSIVQSVIDDFSDQAQEQKVTISFQAGNSIPEMFSDVSRITDCLSNILENALEASPDESSVIIRTSHANGMILVAVQDNGPGISPAEQRKIFKPFYTTKTRGPGLGLAIVERSVKELKGRVDVASRPGRGSTFTLVLPVESSGPE
jgi:signal transduction histidine kinase